MTTQHGRYQLFPDMTEEEYTALKEDIKHKGILVPIEFDTDGNIIDGYHRFRAFGELIEEGVDLPMFDKVERRFESEEAKIEYVLALNLKRRQLNQEQRQELIAKLRRPPFKYTMQKIADAIGISIATVSRDIEALPPEDKAELRALKIEGRDGRTYSANYAPRMDYTTGYQALREHQQTLAKAAAAVVQQTHPVPLTAEQAAAKDEEFKEKLTAYLKDNPHAVVTGEVGEASPSRREVGPDPNEPTTKAPPTIIANTVAKAATELSDDEVARRISAMPWYGGKQSQLSWLLPLLPPSRHFVDLFGGSAAVLLNRPKSDVETYNDLDFGVVNFFKVLRDQPEALLRELALTPFSREERRHAYRTIDTAEAINMSDVEKARLFYVLARQTRAQMSQRSNNMLNSWRWSRDGIQQGLPVYVAQWQSSLDALAYVAARLRQVQIECYPALRILELYNDADTLVYADPPYVLSTRAADPRKREIYANEMTDEDHRALSVALHAHKGMVAVSGYRNALYDELYGDWERIDMPTSAAIAVHAGSNNSENNERIESLWANYPLSLPTP